MQRMPQKRCRLPVCSWDADSWKERDSHPDSVTRSQSTHSGLDFKPMRELQSQDSYVAWQIRREKFLQGERGVSRHTRKCPAPELRKELAEAQSELAAEWRRRGPSMYEKFPPSFGSSPGTSPGSPEKSDESPETATEPHWRGLVISYKAEHTLTQNSTNYPREIKTYVMFAQKPIGKCL